jgi:ubiquinone/menaquinone biosynthesis C-methylase UbiE
VRKENDTRDTQESLRGYYRLHSKIYDATRWSFLFGRHRLIELVASHKTPTRILEVGCGTGTNLVHYGGPLTRRASVEVQAKVQVYPFRISRIVDVFPLSRRIA